MEGRMGDKKSKPSKNVANVSSSALGRPSSLAEAYSERLSLLEAMEAVTRMLTAYPNAKALISDSYMGAVASLLVRYPKQVALDCMSPFTGVALTTKFV